MIEDKLNRIGFKDFVHLNENLRDGKKRMAWGGSYKGSLIHFRIVYEEQQWVFEKVYCDNFQDSLDVFFKNKKDVVDLIEFIEVNC